ncbi:MAG: hypothetical protein V9F82_11810 [Dermatophilaceae bacterium]
MGRPPRCQAHRSATGQPEQRGARAEQTRAPSSITATFQVFASAGSAGRAARASSTSARVGLDGACAAPQTARARTRRTLVSRTGSGMPNAKQATAAAV